MTRSLEENTPGCGFCSLGKRDDTGWDWGSDTRNGKRTGVWCLRRLNWLNLVTDWMWEVREKGQGKDALQFSGWETKWMFLNMQNLRCPRSTFFLSLVPVIANRQYPVLLFPTSHEERAGKNLRNHVLWSSSFYIQGNWDPERLGDFPKGTQDPQPLIHRLLPKARCFLAFHGFHNRHRDHFSWTRNQLPEGINSNMRNLWISYQLMTLNTKITYSRKQR